MNDLVSVEREFERFERVDGGLDDFRRRAMADNVSEDVKGSVEGAQRVSF